MEQHVHDNQGLPAVDEQATDYCGGGNSATPSDAHARLRSAAKILATGAIRAATRCCPPDTASPEAWSGDQEHDVTIADSTAKTGQSDKHPTAPQPATVAPLAEPIDGSGEGD